MTHCRDGKDNRCPSRGHAGVRRRPTEAGTAYYERCQAIATAIDEANDLARQRQAEPAGRLRVASPTLYGRRFLAPVIASYLRAYPRMQVEVHLVNRAVDLIADGFDLAIQIGRLRDSTYTARRLGDSYLYFVASPEYVRTFGAPAPADLPALRCLGFAAVEHWRIDDQLVRVTPVAAMNDLEALCDLAVGGLGIARLPGLVYQDAVRDGRLVRLFPDARVSVCPGRWPTARRLRPCAEPHLTLARGRYAVVWAVARQRRGPADAAREEVSHD